ncbi:MAG: hypothetical protein RBG1_1C00001G0910 [candidate division Zixibacteria bacterium RBG-1]|nr:MAG: hypothetical protein RBG1_1C00001G0910 [candidate division Zixibacteria bacterium RBG-1]OGC86275.1 MAG: hypothetical protein A2V73_05860 [candidate division Zixibacteria bacterium RBG_19FT_COMBO_42_43]
MSPLFILTPLFFVISFIYSSVGLGGGSAYIAALAVSGVPYSAIPTIALSLNLIVSASSWLGYFKSGYFQMRLLLPLVLASVPAAFVGGLVPFSEKSFYLLLGLVLFLSAIWILFSREINPSVKKSSSYKKFIVACGIGMVLGFLAGSLGIGGGIFLAPVLLAIGWTNAKQTAALTSAFIFLNSFSGLLAHLTKQIPDLTTWLPLVAVVLLGGVLGSYAGSTLFSTKLVQKVLGIVLMFASFIIGVKAL